MNIQDLPLPLRLRNALAKAGFKTDTDLRAYFGEDDDSVIPGVGPTGMRQLMDWVNGEKVVEASVEPVVIAPRTFGELADGYGTLEEGIAKTTKRHEVARMVDNAMRGGLEQLDTKRWTTTLSGPAARNTLILQLESDIQARIAGLIPTIKGLPHVKELGVEVSAETVGRMALIRGLDALERAHKVANQAQKAENRADQPENRDDPPVIPPPDDAEELSTPEGWAKVGPNDKIPVPEAVLHDYYTQNGWGRYWGMVDGTPIYFYWSSRRSLQGLDPFPGSDKSGRKVAVQETPWGPGHVVPVKWANS